MNNNDLIVLQTENANLLKTNEFVNDAIVYKLVGKVKFLRIKLFEKNKKPDVLKYINQIESFLKNTEKVVLEHYKLD